MGRSVFFGLLLLAACDPRGGRGHENDGDDEEDPPAEVAEGEADGSAGKGDAGGDGGGDAAPDGSGAPRDAGKDAVGDAAPDGACGVAACAAGDPYPDATMAGTICESTIRDACGQEVWCRPCDEGYACLDHGFAKTCCRRAQCGDDFYAGKCGSLPDGCGGWASCPCAGTCKIPHGQGWGYCHP